MSIKQDQYTLIDDTGREAAAIKTRAGMGLKCKEQEHKAVCRSLLDLLAASHSEELSQVFWIQRVAVAYTGLSLYRPFCSGPQAHR
jgi:hypothetical protein